MPIPLRDDGTAGPSKRHVIFVHGFNSNPKSCWTALIRRLERDPLLSPRFEFSCFGYETALARIAPLKRLPGLDELGAELRAYLDRRLVDGASGQDRYIDTTLVGHSMGGLVIQSCLVQLLDSGRGRELDRIRQAIFFATPHFGSGLLKTFRHLFSAIFSAPQDEALHLFNQQAMHIHEAVRERIIDARSRGDHHYPLPTYCFWGDQDDIVSQWSAKGYFPHGQPLKGSHNDIHRPDLQELTEQYDAFVEVLLHPSGHKHIWEVESFSYCAKVAPQRPGFSIVRRRGGKDERIETDNIANVVRQIRFARNNHCPDPFELRYATGNDGWIDPQWPDHVTSAEKIRIYDERGTRVIADVLPNPNQPSTLSMKVYKGFDAGHRDYHMHLGKRAYFRELLFEVDLSQYIQQGWRVSSGPHLYFHPRDPGNDHRLCGNREMLDSDPPHEVDTRGIWRWTLEHVKEGVVDIVWDVAPGEVARSHDSPSAIVLRPHEHAIFGYGSLLSQASLERTLGRRYTGPFIACDLIGWLRTWDVAMPNSTFVFRSESGSWITPERILYLNATKSPGRRMNGVVFVITDEDLKAFDDREWIYERARVNDHLRGVAVLEGSAWLFVGRPEHSLAAPVDRRRAAVRRTYLDILASGLNDLDPRFAEDYYNSTEVVPSALIIDDVRTDKTSIGAP